VIQQENTDEFVATAAVGNGTKH